MVRQFLAIVALYAAASFFLHTQKHVHELERHIRPLAERSYKAKHVIILVVDGPRYTETWGDPTHQYIPHIANDLAPQGVVYTNFKNTGPTYTNAGHSALTTGFYRDINNNGEELPNTPAIFQYYLAASGAPLTDAWIITTKGKLSILSDCKDPLWHGWFTPSWDSGPGGRGDGYREDAETYERIIEHLGHYHPHLVLINFKQPDAAGHAKDWEGYLKGIRDTDTYVWKIWNWLQADPEFHDNTDLFVTNDHGRHIDGYMDGFISHGDTCSGCRHINLLALGPDIKANELIDQQRCQIDICATAAHILGIGIPGSRGEVMSEMFK